MVADFKNRNLLNPQSGHFLYGIILGVPYSFFVELLLQYTTCRTPRRIQNYFFQPITPLSFLPFLHAHPAPYSLLPAPAIQDTGTHTHDLHGHIRSSKCRHRRTRTQLHTRPAPAFRESFQCVRKTLGLTYTHSGLRFCSSPCSHSHRPFTSMLPLKFVYPYNMLNLFAFFKKFFCGRSCASDVVDDEIIIPLKFTLCAIDRARSKSLRVVNHLMVKFVRIAVCAIRINNVCGDFVYFSFMLHYSVPRLRLQCNLPCEIAQHIHQGQ
nr:MAG TPA: hypothetical protein [Caudoviricetes sp.]